MVAKRTHRGPGARMTQASRSVASLRAAKPVDPAAERCKAARGAMEAARVTRAEATAALRTARAAFRATCHLYFLACQKAPLPDPTA